MTEVIIKLKQDENLRHQLGRTGAEYAIKQFSLESVTNKALAIAKFSLESKDRKELCYKLKASENIITSISNSEIYTIANSVTGGISFTDKCKMKIIHNPILYKLFLKFKGL